MSGLVITKGKNGLYSIHMQCGNASGSATGIKEEEVEGMAAHLKESVTAAGMRCKNGQVSIRSTVVKMVPPTPEQIAEYKARRDEWLAKRNHNDAQALSN